MRPMAAVMDHRPILPDTDTTAPAKDTIALGDYDCIEEEELEEGYSESSSSSEEENIDDTVREDMLKLEESFARHGMEFRLIDRIGEGSYALTAVLLYV